MPSRPTLTLAHSPDPDDAFMWWPITGKISPQGQLLTQPVIDTGRFRFQAVPADIEVLNRRAAERADLDITALSFRAWAAVKDKYLITRAGSSFGDGYGPKVVCPRNSDKVHCENCLRADDVRIAIPGRRTTAFLLLAMLLGKDRVAESTGKIIELPFDQIIPAVARAEADAGPHAGPHAGLVIHEGQLLYESAGLRLVVDLGDWWKRKTGLPLPLGCNAIKQDLDERFGPGTLAEISATLKRSVEYALAHRQESLEYTLPFALANASGWPAAPRRVFTSDPPPPTALTDHEGPAPATLAQIDRYIDMYVNRWSVDLGDEGIAAVTRLFDEGAKAGLCGQVAIHVI
jgi:1,4-dihydroxy-6-naphthoate synthase